MSIHILSKFALSTPPFAVNHQRSSRVPCGRRKRGSIAFGSKSLSSGLGSMRHLTRCKWVKRGLFGPGTNCPECDPLSLFWWSRKKRGECRMVGTWGQRLTLTQVRLALQAPSHRRRFGFHGAGAIDVHRAATLSAPGRLAGLEYIGNSPE